MCTLSSICRILLFHFNIHNLNSRNTGKHFFIIVHVDYGVGFSLFIFNVV